MAIFGMSSFMRFFSPFEWPRAEVERIQRPRPFFPIGLIGLIEIPVFYASGPARLEGFNAFPPALFFRLCEVKK